MIIGFIIDCFLNLASFLIQAVTGIVPTADITTNLLEAFSLLSKAFVMARTILSLYARRLFIFYSYFINTIFNFSICCLPDIIFFKRFCSLGWLRYTIQPLMATTIRGCVVCHVLASLLFQQLCRFTI